MDDDELRDRLQRADPAAGRPGDPGGIHHLAEVTMATETPPPRDAVVRRVRKMFIGAAAAVCVIAAAALGFQALRGDDGGDGDSVADAPPVAASSTPPTDSSTPSATGSPTGTETGEATDPTASSSATESGGEPVLSATVPENSARCRQPTADLLAELATTAVGAKVTAIEGKQATLSVKRSYLTESSVKRGDTIELSSSSIDLVQQVGGITFEEDHTYLVSINRADELMICGLSGPATGDLREIYEQAFN